MTHPEEDVTTNSESTSGQTSVLGGNQVNAPISAPINVEGIAASILGAEPQTDSPSTPS